MSATVDDYTTILIVGKTGYGKSSTGNTILGRRAFKTSGNITSTSKTCEKAVSKVQGQKVVVVDSPGLADTDKNTEQGLLQFTDELTNMLSKLQTIDAIFIVFKYGTKLTAEDDTVFQQLEAVFGGPEHVKQFGVLVFTAADMYNQEENHGMLFEEFLNNQTGLFPGILQKCKNRLVVLNNNTKDESVRQSQVKRILDMVKGMKSTGNRCDSNNILRMAQEVRDKALINTQKPFIDEKTNNELQILLQELQEMRPDSTDSQKIYNIKKELEKQHKALIEQDKGTGVLQSTISRVEAVKTTCDLKLEAKSKHDLEQSNEALSRLCSDLQENLKQENEKKDSYLKAALGFGLGAILTGVIMYLNPAVGVTIAKKEVVAFVTRHVTKELLIRSGTTLYAISQYGISVHITL